MEEPQAKEEFRISIKIRRARSFAQFILSRQSEILRFAQNDSEGLRMTAGKRFSVACLVGGAVEIYRGFDMDGGFVP